MKSKKIIAVLLTLIMVTAMLPTAFAEVETSSVDYIFKSVDYDGPSDVRDGSGVNLDGSSSLTGYTENRNWAYLGYTGTAPNSSYYVKITNSFQGKTPQGGWIALKIKAPETGIYSVAASAYMYNRNTNNMEIYLVPMNAVLDTGSGKTASDVFDRTDATQKTDIYGTVTKGVCTGYASFAGGKLETTLGTTYDISSYLVGSTNTRVAQTDTNHATVLNCVLDNAKTVKVTDDIEEYVLLFVSNGTGSLHNTYPSSLMLTKVEEDISAPTHVTLATSTSIAPNTIKVVGDKYTRGTEVTVTAEKIDGYTFRHWVRGTAENGDWVSADEEYTFTLATNTFLTAVYTPTATEDSKIVEFFNGNGEYITEETVVDGKVTLPTDPKMTGFSFKQWIVDRINDVSVVFENANIEAALTRVVAEFEDTNDTFTVDGDNTLKYDAVVTKNSTSGEAVAWYRDGNLVGYGPSYKYHVWASVGEITQSEITTKAPVVYLDPTIKDTARMIEYDAGDKEIAEVGILFGDGTNMTVDSCKYKATSQENGGDDGHGQFTAKPSNDSYTTALGYLIYKDGNTYKVVYSD